MPDTTATPSRSPEMSTIASTRCSTSPCTACVRESASSERMLTWLTVYPESRAASLNPSAAPDGP